MGRGGLTPDGVIYYQVVRGSIARSKVELASLHAAKPDDTLRAVVTDFRFDRVKGTHRGIEIRDFSARPDGGILAADGTMTFGQEAFGWNGRAQLRLEESSVLLPWFTRNQ